MDIATFRADLPEFTDSTRYPDSQITRWLSVAAILLDGDIWGDLLDFGTELFIAHNLTLWRQNADAAASGGKVGATSGITASKSVDTVSIGYDTGAMTIEGAAQWNATTYGIQFFQLARQLGHGATGQVNSGALAIQQSYGIGYGYS